MNHTNLTNHMEAAGATVASVASAATWSANVSAGLTIAVNVLTLAWWIRVWLKNPHTPPPPALPR